MRLMKKEINKNWWNDRVHNEITNYITNIKWNVRFKLGH